MERKLVMTRDGSHSVTIPELNVTYHSVHGAIQESKHVFIQSGLIHSGLFEYTGVHSVLEIGFGTGLNALLTLLEADRHQNRIYYTAVEPYPLDEQSAGQLNYCEQLQQPDYQVLFERMHAGPWEEVFEISEFFRLTKHQSKLDQSSLPDETFHLVYFDAFAPTAQPELWTEDIFRQLYRSMTPDGILVTYCSKSIVRRALQAAGFTVTKPPGPWGKREMLRAGKRV